MDIKRRVKKLVRMHCSNNPFEIIKSLNVIYISCPLDGVRGFYQYFQRNNLIYVDEKLSDIDRMFVCAHELGHMFLHKKANTIFMDSRTYLNTSKFETEADKFAIELLISDESLLKYDECTLEQLSRIYGYHQKLIELRLK